MTSPPPPRKRLDASGLLLGTLMFLSFAAAVWFIMIPALTEHNETMRRTMPTCESLGKDRTDVERRRVVERCHRQRAADSYVISIMSMI